MSNNVWVSRLDIVVVRTSLKSPDRNIVPGPILHQHPVMLTKAGFVDKAQDHLGAGGDLKLVFIELERVPPHADFQGWVLAGLCRWAWRREEFLKRRSHTFVRVHCDFNRRRRTLNFS